MYERIYRQLKSLVISCNQFRDVVDCSQNFKMRSSIAKQKFFEANKLLNDCIKIENLLLRHNQANLYELSYSPRIEEAEVLLGGNIVKSNFHNEQQLLYNGKAKVLSFPLNEKATDLLSIKVYGNAILLEGICRW